MKTRKEIDLSSGLTGLIFRNKTGVVMLYDLVVIFFALTLAFVIRLEVWPDDIWEKSAFWVLLAVFIPVQMGLFVWAGLYRGIWRFSSTNDLFRIFISITGGILLTAFLFFLYNRLEGIPRTIFIMLWFILIVSVGGGRFSYRVFRDFVLPSRGHNVLIVGAGRTGEQLFREFKMNMELDTQVVGFIDDEPMLKNRILHGVPILGDIEDLDMAVRKTQAREVIIAIPGITSSQIRRIVSAVSGSGVRVKRVPGLASFVDGRVHVSQLRALSPEDLLGRPSVHLDLDAIGSMIAGRTIMVTGAGGSIGAEICRQVAAFGPARLVLFEISEYFLYELDMELRQKYPGLRMETVIGDVRNRSRVRETLERFRPDAIYHAAAYKHVPMMEGNAFESVQNNVGGTLTVAEEAMQLGVERFILVSTDKAVNPTNVMGATKRLGEMICQSLQKKSQTKFLAVRFGNVLGSTGSVIPLFTRQIAAGGPVTVTHPEIRRYFMSIPEAVQLVLQAGAMGEGGEIFVLDMGEPVKIVDLAREMITLSGFIPEKEIPIVFTGLRPGEKLFEELLNDEESTLPTPHPAVRVAKMRSVNSDFVKKIVSLLALPSTTSVEKVRSNIKSLVPEYSPATHSDPPGKLKLVKS